MHSVYIGGLHFHLPFSKPRRLLTHTLQANIGLHWKKIIIAKSVPLMSWNARIKLAFNAAPCCVYIMIPFLMIQLHHAPCMRSLLHSVHRNSWDFLMRIWAGFLLALSFCTLFCLLNSFPVHVWIGNLKCNILCHYSESSAQLSRSWVLRLSSTR